MLSIFRISPVYIRCFIRRCVILVVNFGKKCETVNLNSKMKSFLCSSKNFSDETESSCRSHLPGGDRYHKYLGMLEVQNNMTSRTDGRAPNQLRQLICATGILNKADGSARWAQGLAFVNCMSPNVMLKAALTLLLGETSVLAAVYGPHSVQGRRENAEKAIVEVIFKPKTGQPGIIIITIQIILVLRTRI